MQNKAKDLPPAYVFWAIPMAPFLNGCECTFMPNGDASCEEQQENIKARSIVAIFPIEEGRKRHEKLRVAAAEYRRQHVVTTKQLRDINDGLMQPEDGAQEAAC